MVGYKDHRFYVKKTTSGKPVFYRLGKSSGMHPVVKGGNYIVGPGMDRTIRKVPQVPKEFLDTIGKGQSKHSSSKDIIHEIDKALNNWSISKAPQSKRPIKGGFLNFLDGVF